MKMKWKPWMTALGISLSVTLALWIARTGARQEHVIDLAGSLIATSVTVWLGWLISGRLTPDPERRGLVALIAGLWGLLFNTFHIAAMHYVGPMFENAIPAALTWTALCSLLAWGVSRGKQSLTFLPRMLAISMVTLFVSQGFQLKRILASEKPEANVVDRRDGKLPDVFVVLLDKYTSGAWLSHTYHLDHQPFEDSLRALGFVVPKSARANYTYTHVALASFLNAKYISPSAPGKPPRTWRGMRSLIRNAPVWSVFHDRGYRVITFPTNFIATRNLKRSDAWLRSPTVTPSPFAATWILNSVLARVGRNCGGRLCPESEATPYPAESLAEIEWKLATLASLPDSAGPVFAFLHLLAPHEPYLFNADCTPRKPWWPPNDQGENFDLIPDAYASQVKCLDRLLLKTMRAILQRSKVEPVIVLQSDHGHGRITTDRLRGFSLTAKELTPDQLGERLGIFAAYRFPGADTTVYADISPVNVLPLIESSLFGGTPRKLPDKSFWSPRQDPFAFVEIPPEATRPPEQGH